MEYEVQLSGGMISGHMAGEKLVCKFTGPETVFLQTRNPVSLALIRKSDFVSIMTIEAALGV